MFKSLAKWFKRDRSTNDLIQSKSSQNLYLGVMYGSFIAATAISAIVNVLMFSQLSSIFYEQCLFIAISITLEGTKVLSILKSSVLMNVGKKIDIIMHQRGLAIVGRNGKKAKNSATKAGQFYFRLYLAFAFIAIFASMGLTLTITSRVNSSANLEINKISATSSVAESDIKVQEKKLADLGFDEIKKKYEDAAEANEQYQVQIVEINAVLREANWKDPKASSDLAKVKGLQKALNLDSKKTAYESALAKKTEIESIIEKDRATIGNATIGAAEVKSQQDKEVGTANMFALMASTFRVVSEVILRIIVLMGVSLLIEVTLFTAAPEININRKILYYFRKYLPEDLDIDALLEEFDKDVSRFAETPTAKSASVDAPIEEVRQPLDKGPISFPSIPIADSGSVLPESQTPVPVPAPKRPRLKKPGQEAPRQKTEVVQSIPGTPIPPVNEEPEPEFFLPVAQGVQLSQEVPDDQATVTDGLSTEALGDEKPSPTVSDIDGNAQVHPGASVQGDQEKRLLRRRLPKAENPNDEPTKVDRPQEAEIPKETVEEPKAEEPKAEKPVDLPVVSSPPVAQEPAPVAQSAHVSKVTANVVNYRFGKTSEAIKEHLVRYVKGMMEGLDDLSSYPAKIHDPVKVAADLGLPEKVRDILLTRLKAMKYGEVPLIRENPDGSYVTNFNPVFLIDWTTEVRP